MPTMKRYEASFIGRTNGSIGVRYPIVTWVVAENAEEARSRLYDHYEHIHNLRLTVQTKRENAIHG